MANYTYVASGSKFSPFTFQEMMAPFALYKEAYDKAEDTYIDLSSKADKFKYLSETLPEGSKARQMYEGYANELSAQAGDLARNGLTLENRAALTNLRRRYQGEIGRLDLADQALQQEKQLRRTMNAKDSSMLYAQDNLSIDDFLDGGNPNLYNISGTELYTRGAAAGKAASSRIYSDSDEGSTLGGYYRKWVERNGYSKESIDAFRANASAIPELQQAADSILAERGVLNNLTGANLERARQSVLNGIIDGAVYQEKVNPVRDPGVMSVAETRANTRADAADQRAQEQWDIQKDLMYQKNEKTGKWELNPTYANDNYEIDPNTGKLKKKSPQKQTAEEKTETNLNNLKSSALLKLESSDLANNDGFDVTFGGSYGTTPDRHHYNYIGAISKHGNKWHHGAIGEDNPGHGGLFGWGWASTSNVENAWGNFSAEGSDSNKLRVLAPSEFASLIQTDPNILDAIEKRCKAAGVDPTTADIQIVEVPNEKGGGGQKGYLIAVH